MFVCLIVCLFVCIYMYVCMYWCMYVCLFVQFCIERQFQKVHHQFSCLLIPKLTLELDHAKLLSLVEIISFKMSPKIVWTCSCLLYTAQSPYSHWVFERSLWCPIKMHQLKWPELIPGIQDTQSQMPIKRIYYFSVVLSLASYHRPISLIILGCVTLVSSLWI